MAGLLVGERDDAGEQGRSDARSANRVPARGLAGEALVRVDRPVAGCTHGDIRNTSMLAYDSRNAVLVGGPLEDDRLAAAAGKRVRVAAAGEVTVGRAVVGVIPNGVGRRAIAGSVEMQLRAADSGHKGVAVRP